MFLFGSATPISKIIGDAFSVSFAGTIRIFLVFLLFLPFINWKILKKLSVKEWFLMAGVGIIGVTGFTVFMLYGMKYASGVGGSIIMSCAPAVTAFFSFLFFHDKLGWRKIVALTLGIAGVLVLNFAGEGSENSENMWLGIFLIFLAILCDAAYTLFGKVLTEKCRSVDIAGISALFGLIAFLPWFFIKGDFPEWQKVEISSWIYLFIYGVVIAGIGALLWYKGVKEVSGSTASGFMIVMPLSALILSYFLLGEKFEWWHLIGFGLVFIGVILIIQAHIKMEKSEK